MNQLINDLDKTIIDVNQVKMLVSEVSIDVAQMKDVCFYFMQKYKAQNFQISSTTLPYHKNSQKGMQMKMLDEIQDNLNNAKNFHRNIQLKSETLPHANQIFSFNF